MVETLIIVLGSITGCLIAVTGFITALPNCIKVLNCDCYKKTENKTDVISMSNSNPTPIPNSTPIPNPTMIHNPTIIPNYNLNSQTLKNDTILLYNSRWGEKLYLDRHKNQQDIIAWSRDIKGGQEWTIEFINKNKTKALLYNSRWGEKMYLDRHTNKLNIIAWPRDNNGGQEWDIEYINNNTIRLSNSRWGKKVYLDRHINKRDIIVWSKDNKKGQEWKIKYTNI